MGVIIPDSLPAFSYTGTYETQLRADWGWIIRFKTDGVLTFTEDQKIDLYLHGGGGGGGGGANPAGGGGGGGGYLATHKDIEVKAGTPYSIVVGKGGTYGYGASEEITYPGSGGEGKPSSAFGYSVKGGGGGGTGGWSAGFGGAGAAGGSGNGGSGGGSTGSIGGVGGSNSVREFGGDETWPIYGGGGGGGAGRSGGNGAGGSPYGAKGGYNNAAANTGAGGGGGNSMDSGGAGGSGIVCIRSGEVKTLPVVFNGTALTQLFFNGTQVKSLIYDGVKLFFRRFFGKETDHGAVYGTG